MKSVVLAVAALGLSAGVASAQSWEAVAIAETVVMAVDWSSLRINGSTRRVTVAVVTGSADANAGFDYATSALEVDCTESRYLTYSSSFYWMDGSRSAEDFTGGSEWEAVNPGSLVADMRVQVCASSASRPGFFSDPQTFAANARAVFAQQ